MNAPLRQRQHDVARRGVVFLVRHHGHAALGGAVQLSVGDVAEGKQPLSAHIAAQQHTALCRRKTAVGRVIVQCRHVFRLVGRKDIDVVQGSLGKDSFHKALHLAHPGLGGIDGLQVHRQIGDKQIDGLLLGRHPLVDFLFHQPLGQQGLLFLVAGHKHRGQFFPEREQAGVVGDVLRPHLAGQCLQASGLFFKYHQAAALFGQDLQQQFEHVGLAGVLPAQNGIAVQVPAVQAVEAGVILAVSQGDPRRVLQRFGVFLLLTQQAEARHLGDHRHLAGGASLPLFGHAAAG